jgi:hypothetical protein
MRRRSPMARRTGIAIALTFVVSLLVVTSAAQAVVVNVSGVGRFGVALVPGTSTAGIPIATSSPPCSDPWLSPDLTLPATGLCSHGGPVIHNNETFAFTWDPDRRYWQTTRDYVEQFLRDVANASGTLTSPYAVTGQYRDANGAAANASLYGGGCIDFGGVGGSACKFDNTDGTGVGHDYPTSGGCTATGSNRFHEELSGVFDSTPNDVCVTAAQLQGELAALISQTGLLTRTRLGYTPLVVLLTPPGVETCLNSAGTLCSANGASTGPFCSYHSQVNVGGAEVTYVVQPWTALTACDEPDAPLIPQPPEPDPFAKGVGLRLVSPLSQGELAAIVNPGLNGWFALNGAEINDNGCIPLDHQRDSVTVGSSAQNPYLLRREFNNAGVIETDPNAPSCAPSVALAPTFVVPSAVTRGDAVQFDGSTTVSSLIVPKADYLWNFGDGTTAVGPSVVHSYANGGTYSVTLTVIDRGGNVRSLTQPIGVLGASGQPVSPPPPQTHRGPTLRVRLQLMPQGLQAMLRVGVAARVSSNEAANGLATLSISRQSAKRARIRVGRGETVVIGRGTVSRIKTGTVNLHMRLSRVMSARLRRLRHVTLTVRLALVDGGGAHLTIDAAGRY